MIKAEARRQDLINHLLARGSVTIEALSVELAVSKMTIHRDLEDLEQAGLLRRIRGGATIEASASFESDFRYRQTQAAEEKARIAAYAARFVEAGQSVLIDDGSTTGAMAARLADIRPLTIITNNLSVLQATAANPGHALIALGGQYNKRFNGFFGLLAEDALRGLRADVAFVSSSSLLGLSAYHQDAEVLQIKRLMIENAARAYLLVDHSKFGRAALHHLVALTRFEAIVTGRELGEAYANELKAAQIRFHLAD